MAWNAQIMSSKHKTKLILNSRAAKLWSLMVPHPVDVLVGKRVRARRTELGMSQTQLAEVLKITFQQVQKYERGANRVTCSRLSDIATALNVPITFFFSEPAMRAARRQPIYDLDIGDIADGRRLLTAFQRLPSKTFKLHIIELLEKIVEA
jgi:transcriptional regulator with XRE-family HTH domain